MTRDKDRKRIIRTRMKTTGESYTAARRQILARAAKRGTPLAAPHAPAVDHAAITGKSDDTMTRRTGRDWREWRRVLDADGAATMTHGAIARLVHEKYDISGWWAQTVTVGYERLTGRREAGQRINGAYEASKSKTFNVPVTTLFDAFAKDRTRRRWLDEVKVSIRSATSPKSLRLQWPDGTIVAAWFESKGAQKSSVAIAHTKLASRAALEQAKAAWGQRLDALARMLARA